MFSCRSIHAPMAQKHLGNPILHKKQDGQITGTRLRNAFNMKSSLQITSDCYQSANYGAANTRSTLLPQVYQLPSLSHQCNSKCLQVRLANLSKTNTELLKSF